ncbi:hypothetical protein RB201_20155 [Streptomyces sp. S1A(2023)]
MPRTTCADSVLALALARRRVNVFWATIRDHAPFQTAPAAGA